MRRGWLVLVVGTAALTAGCDQTPDKSGAYPDGAINLIVPAEAGDITDTVARCRAVSGRPARGRRSRAEPAG